MAFAEVVDKYPFVELDLVQVFRVRPFIVRLRLW